jgi:hypothetical protein
MQAKQRVFAPWRSQPTCSTILLRTQRDLGLRQDWPTTVRNPGNVTRPWARIRIARLMGSRCN